MIGGAMDRPRTRALQQWFLLLTLAGLLAAGAVVSPASAAPGWSRPMAVSGVVSIGEESPLLNVDSAGNATAVWQRYRGGKPADLGPRHPGSLAVWRVRMDCRSPSTPWGTRRPSGDAAWVAHWSSRARAARPEGAGRLLSPSPRPARARRWWRPVLKAT